MDQPKAPSGLLARLGAGSPLIVTAVYAVGYIPTLVFATVAERTGMRALTILGLFVWLIAFGFAYAIVTWHREDDVLASAFLLGVSVVLSNFVIGLLAGGIVQGAIGGAMLAFTGGILGLVVGGAIMIAICALLIAVGRAIKPGIATPVPPAMKH